MLCNRAGVWNAYPSTIGVDETGNPPKCTVQFGFDLVQEDQGGEFVDVTAEGLTITAYVYLEKNDGTLNLDNVKMLKDAFGWNPADLAPWFQENEAELAKKAVTVVTAMDEFNGKVRPKVRWINPLGHVGGGGGGVTKADAPALKAMNNRMGSQLRALGGGTPAKSAPPSGTPKAPPAKKLAPPPAKSAAIAPCSRDEAWEAVQDADKWANLVTEAGISDETTATPEQWGKVKHLALMPF